jgi:multidrug efflux pump subunit AcrA (membrane-fusion protein)
MQFRFKALQRMREPDELDTVILLANPRGWIAAFVVLIVVAGACVWAFAGQIPRTLTASGLLTHPLGVSQLQTMFTGQISQLSVVPEERVTAGQTVMSVTDPAGQTHPVVSPFTGTVISVATTAGQVVSAGSTVLTVERTDAPGDHLLAMVFVPASQAIGVRPGDPVDIAVSSDPAPVFGLLRGRVVSVSPYPLTQGALDTLLGGDLAARSFATVTDPQLVVIDMVRDPKTASGYAWTSAAGPPGGLRSQVTVTASINLGSERPVNLVLGR